jgi:hypothetical protein
LINLDRRFLRMIVAAAAALLGLCSLFAVRLLAQSGDTPWGTVVNLSRSGAASQPAIVAAADGTLHVLWWDAEEGEQYARTANASDATWTPPEAIPAIYGSSKVDIETGRTKLTAPRAARLIAPASGGLHALWIDDKDRLLDISSDGTSWRNDSTPMAESALAFDIASDPAGTLHLAYVRPINTTEAPAGIYYRANTGTGWSAPSLVYSSQYYRSAKPGDVDLSVAGDNAGHAIVAWGDPQTRQSTYAWTADGGTSWSAPQVITGTTAGRALQARVALAPNGAWLLIWRDLGAGGCGFLQRQSPDGGQTWGAPEKVLSSITRCDESWIFRYGADGRLWMTGHPAAVEQDSTSNAATAAVWDGAAWSRPIDVSLTSYDPGTAQAITLNCIEAAVAGSTAGVVGCDPSGDIWAARSTTDPGHLIDALKPTWKPVEIVSGDVSAASANDLPALAIDKQGNPFAIWSQATDATSAEAALFGAVQSNDRWSRSTLLLRSPDRPNQLRTARQPSLAVDAQDKIHTVWSSGPNSPVVYSWAFARDFNGPTAWAEPTALPSATSASSWPDIAADSTGKHLYVIYARPFNEQRGIYLARSLDGGSTWLTPTLVFDAAAANWDSIDKPHIALDEQSNVLHAVWLQSTWPGSTSARAVYYARSTDQGEAWSTPLKISEGDVDWPQLSLVTGNDVYVAWTQSASKAGAKSPTPYSVWGKYSSDGGARWSQADPVPGFDQVSGPLGLGSDGAGHLYLAAVGEGTGSESVLLVSQWKGGVWSDQDTIGLGQPAARDNAAAVAIAPAAGRLTVLLRLQTLGQDNQGQFEVAATGRDIAPGAVLPPPTFTPMPTTTPEPTATLRPTPRPQLLSSDKQQPAATTRQGPPPLVLGGVLAAIIVIGVAVWRTVTARRQ